MDRTRMDKVLRIENSLQQEREGILTVDEMILNILFIIAEKVYNVNRNMH